jgi:hypothetical protein
VHNKKIIRHNNEWIQKQIYFMNLILKMNSFRILSDKIEICSLVSGLQIKNCFTKRLGDG